MRGSIKGFPASLAAGAVISAAVCALNVSRDYGWSRSVCDGLFVASVMLLGTGAIRAASNQGAFDVAGYGLHTVLEMTMPFLRRTGEETFKEEGSSEAERHSMEEEPFREENFPGEKRPSGKKEDIHQYRARREAQRKSPAGLLLAGGLYFILSLAALAIYELT